MLRAKGSVKALIIIKMIVGRAPEILSKKHRITCGPLAIIKHFITLAHEDHGALINDALVLVEDEIVRAVDQLSSKG